jgi:hypothetical protein
MPQSEEVKELELGEEPEEFGELVRYTLAGYAGGLVLGFQLFVGCRLPLGGFGRGKGGHDV